jgi:hypothetical protein
MSAISRQPKYPWCTGAPRPVLLSCADSEDHLVTYFVAPIVGRAGTGIIRFRNVTELSHVVMNNDKNNLFSAPHSLLEDSISILDGTTYLFFHNEYFRIKGDLVEESLGDSSNSLNISAAINLGMDRET